MTEVRIHNGEIVGQEAAPERPKAAAPPSDLNPDALAALIAREIAQAFAEEPRPLPIQVVNRLLQLKSPGGHKVLWTRFDLFKLYGLYTKELERSGGQAAGGSK